MHRSIKIILIAEEGSEESSRSFTAEGNNLDELMANAHAQLDRAINDVESATHHKDTDSASTGEPFSAISLEEQRRLRFDRDEDLRKGLERDRAVRAQARGGRGRMPNGNTGAP